MKQAFFIFHFLCRVNDLRSRCSLDVLFLKVGWAMISYQRGAQSCGLLYLHIHPAYSHGPSSIIPTMCHDFLMRECASRPSPKVGPPEFHRVPDDEGHLCRVRRRKSSIIVHPSNQLMLVYATGCHAEEYLTCNFGIKFGIPQCFLHPWVVLTRSSYEKIKQRVKFRFEASRIKAKMIIWS